MALDGIAMYEVRTFIELSRQRCEKWWPWWNGKATQASDFCFDFYKALDASCKRCPL